jgi:hypothetical protein
MISTPVYKLSVRAHTPDTVVEGELFEIVYHIKNVGNNTFPGGIVPIRVSWANLGPNAFVTQAVDINRPLNPNDTFVFTVKETPMAAGYTLFQPIMGKGNVVPLPAGNVLLFLADGRQIVGSMIFGAVRARSHEEIFQEEAVVVARKTLKWALVALVVTAIVGLVELMLGILKG